MDTTKDTTKDLQMENQVVNTRPELGNLLFGHSRGEHPFPDRDLVDAAEWRELLDRSRSDSYGYTDASTDSYGHIDLSTKNSRGGYENDVFSIKPYWWGNDDNEEECDAPNFLYKPTGFEIRWYKYPFRDSYMSKDLTSEQVLEIFRKCAKSIETIDYEKIADAIFLAMCEIDAGHDVGDYRANIVARAACEDTNLNPVDVWEIAKHLRSSCKEYENE